MQFGQGAVKPADFFMSQTQLLPIVGNEFINPVQRAVLPSAVMNRFSGELAGPETSFPVAGSGTSQSR